MVFNGKATLPPIGRSKAVLPTVTTNKGANYTQFALSDQRSGLRSATTAQSYDPSPSRSSFGQHGKNKGGAWRSGGAQSAMEVATNDGGMVEEYEEDLLATGDIQEINRRLNAAFREGIAWERVGRYDKMSVCYQRLFTLFFKYCRKLDQSLLKQGFGVLFYELHAHYGVALAHIGDHRKAAREFTFAIEAVSAPKGTCRAGCKTLSCLHPPLFTKRAISHVLMGNRKQALNDANRACMLDSRNPDVYCMRALVKGTINKTIYMDEILTDLNHVLSMDADHVAGLILRGSFDPKEQEQKLYAWKACRKNPDAQVFIPITDLNHHDINRFLDRYFHALSIPHSIMDVRVDWSLLKPSPNQRGRGRDLRSRALSKSAEPPPPITLAPLTIGQKAKISPEAIQIASRSKTAATSDSSTTASWRKPFRCGTPGQTTGDDLALRRRKEYGLALYREMESAKKEKLISNDGGGSISEIFGMDEERMIPLNTKCSGKMWAKLRYATEKNWSSGNQDGDEEKHASQVEDGSVVKVFEPVLASSARMYCRPWAGDQIPTIEIPAKTDHVVPFRA